MRARIAASRHWLPWVLVAVLGLWIAAPALRDLVLRPRPSAALRGREVARRLGCFGCHGPGGRGGVRNPGSRHRRVPPFTGSTLMMYVRDEAEIRETILDRRPARLADDPAAKAERARQAIAMPAYRDRLGPGDLDLLVAYVRQVSGMLEPPEGPPREGAEVARRLGCFGCHGPLGMGGVSNPGSLKGYVPGFLGEDYRELVRDGAELREWIRRGSIERIERHWIGGFFLRRQLIHMPAYERFLEPGELDALAAYVEWIASGGPEREPLS